MDALRGASAAWLLSLGDAERGRGCQGGRGSTTARLVHREPGAKILPREREETVERGR